MIINIIHLWVINVAKVSVSITQACEWMFFDWLVDVFQTHTKKILVLKTQKLS